VTEWNGANDPYAYGRDGVPGEWSSNSAQDRAGHSYEHNGFRVADDYYLIAYHGLSERRRPDSSVASIGVAAGLLGELILADWLTISGSGVWLLQGTVPLADPLLTELLTLMQSLPDEHGLDTWLAHIATEALDDVRGRLASSGVLIKSARRRFIGKQVVYEPANSNTVVWPTVRLTGQLSRVEPITLADAVLAGLVHATGLTGHLLWDPASHRPGLEYLPDLLRALPAPFLILLERTEVAAGRVLLTKRA
jgi:hypothetical protein